jgi:dihydropteroate synthase
MFWQTTRFKIDLARPKVMGIVNLTPDSFSDGGRFEDVRAALEHCEALLSDGADILDLGAESTRPGAVPLPLQQELARLMPVLTEAVKLGVPISVDTYKPEVMQAALDQGADIINDVWALRHPAALPEGLTGLQVVSRHPACGVCLMHMHREPESMQVQPMSGDVVAQVLEFLKQSIQVLQASGVKKDRIFLDPGIGFGKTPEQNFTLLAHQHELLQAQCGLLVGWSRKRSLGWALNDGAEHAQKDVVASRRVSASVTAALLGLQNGAHVVRVHDVRDTVDAIRVWQAMQAQVGTACTGKG